eukprot:m.69941 g.69941  ORF g.69941 m.69941 type:complete len:97 (-) comp12243_c0_seq1:27-317(-)
MRDKQERCVQVSCTKKLVHAEQQTARGFLLSPVRGTCHACRESCQKPTQQKKKNSDREHTHTHTEQSLAYARIHVNSDGVHDLLARLFMDVQLITP